MKEIDVYKKLRRICVAHENDGEHKRANGFGVGYIHQISADNFDQSKYQKDYFYSEIWNKMGKPKNDLKMDFPFVLLLPMNEKFSVSAKGSQKGDGEFGVSLMVWDLIGRDRNGNIENSIAKRGKEDLWQDMRDIGGQIVAEFGRKDLGREDNVLILNGGEIEVEKWFDTVDERLAAVQLNFSIRTDGDCGVGVFDYDKEEGDEVC